MFFKKGNEEEMERRITEHDIEQRRKQHGGRAFFLTGALLILLVAIYVFSDDITGNVVSVTDPYAHAILLGTFVDAGKGEYYAVDYDVFVNGVTKGRFSSALEACKILYPGATSVFSSLNPDAPMQFTNSQGEQSVRTSYLNECYR